MNLKYSSCGVTDFSAIAFLTNLTELTIDEDLTNLHLSQICENCRYLKVLELKGIGPAPTDFSGLRSLPLVQIKIFTRGFNDSGMSAVADISSLRILSLSGRSVTDFGLLCLVSGCGQQLEELEIGGNSITDLGVTEVLRNCFQLRTIKLSTIRISDVSITTVADCHSLQILHLSSGPLVTSVGLRNLYCDRKLRHIMTPLIIRWTKWPEVSVEHELVAILATVNVTLKVW